MKLFASILALLAYLFILVWFVLTDMAIEYWANKIEKWRNKS